MKVFCPNCGQANEAQPGQRVMCTACTAVFDAPSAAGMAPPPAPPPPAPAPVQPQVYQQPTYATPQVQPAPQWQQPYPGQVAQAGAGQKTNTLAIVSLVLGILCCIPFASIAAIVTGVIAMKQIDQDPTQTGKGLAIAGAVLGGLSLLMSIVYFIAAAAGGVQ